MWSFHFRNEMPYASRQSPQAFVINRQTWKGRYARAEYVEVLELLFEVERFMWLYLR
jgi:hypothetical protein